MHKERKKKSKSGWISLSSLLMNSKSPVLKSIAVRISWILLGISSSSLRSNSLRIKLISISYQQVENYYLPILKEKELTRLDGLKISKTVWQLGQIPHIIKLLRANKMLYLQINPIKHLNYQRKIHYSGRQASFDSVFHDQFYIFIYKHNDFIDENV